MLPFEPGKTYFIETPVWYYFGEVAEVSPLWVRFKKCAQVHNLSDLPTTLATGTFPAGTEISPLPDGWVIPMIHVGPFGPWPFKVPTQRTHAAVT